MLNVQQFDEQAKGVLAGAYRVSQRFAHGTVDTPHLLMALLEQTESNIPAILDRLAVDGAALSARLDELLRAQPAVGQSTNLKQVFIMPTAKQALSRVADEAKQLETEVVTPEHLLLALLREPGAALAGVLAEFGITYDRVLVVVQSQ